MVKQLIEVGSDDEGPDLLKMTVDVVAAQISNNPSQPGDVPGLLQTIHAALSGLAGGAQEAEASGAVPIMDPRKSVKPDAITCLICGKKSQILKPHLRAVHGLDADQYRDKFDLPASYPMASKKYVDAARDRALKLGLGARMQAGRSFNKEGGKTRAALVAAK